MLILLVACAVVIIILLLAIAFKLFSNTNRTNPELLSWMQDLSNRLDQNTQTVDNKLSQNMLMFHSRLDKTTQALGELQKNLGEISEIGRSMHDLQQFINSPKLRGNIGEQILRDILAQHFPKDAFTLQYAFKSGEKVDAIIRITAGLIPIDAKFPFSNFRKMNNTTVLKEKEDLKKEFEKDVRKHITDIAKKYILVTEGTVDYALMYVPSEAVFYEIVNQAELYDYATSKRVLPVSPLTFYAYMKAILMSYEGQKIQSQAKEIFEMLRSIEKDYEKTDESLSVLMKHITNAYNQSSQVSKTFTQLGQKLTSTRSLTHGVADADTNLNTMQEKLLD